MLPLLSASVGPAATGLSTGAAGPTARVALSSAVETNRVHKGRRFRRCLFVHTFVFLICRIALT